MELLKLLELNEVYHLKRALRGLIHCAHGFWKEGVWRWN